MTAADASRRRLFAFAVVGAATLGGALPASAQNISCERGETEVRELRFAGNRAFTDAELADAIVTTPSGRLRRYIRIAGTRRCLDNEHLELRRDVLRLTLLYRNAGYPDVAVDTLLRAIDPTSVSVAFVVREGAPTRVRSLRVEGLDSVVGSRRLATDLPLRLGAPFDKRRYQATEDTLVRRLRNRGYPAAEVLKSFESSTRARTADVVYTLQPGPLVRLGRLIVRAAPYDSTTRQQIGDETVRRIARLDSGEIYRERDLVAAQRALYQTDAYRQVEVRAVRPDSALGDSVVDVLIALREDRMYAASAGVGYGTLDCFRVQGSLVDRHFLNAVTAFGGARQLQLNARVSKIGVGRPLDAFPGLCFLQEDPYSELLNYSLSATIRQPVLFGLRTVPELTLFSERRSEYKAFLRRTPIGALITVPRLSLGPLRHPMVFSYRVELGRTEAQPALFCAVFNICEADDRARRERQLRLAVLSWAITRDRTNSPLNPSRGTLSRAEIRHASNAIGSDATLEFNKAVVDLSRYWPAGGRGVFAARLRAGGVFGSNVRNLNRVSEFIPPEERLYGGGPTTVRGFRQNELGPAVYVASSVDSIVYGAGSGDSIRYLATAAARTRTVPTGGNSLVVANLEYRFRPILPELLQFNVFADAGEVWNRGRGEASLSFKEVRVTPGAGVRLFTFVGAVGIDVGYNPYERDPGAIYFEPRDAEGGRGVLYCASPSAATPVVRRERLPDGTLLETQSGSCPAAFAPGRSSSFFRRLAFQFSIGQAF